MGNKSSWAILKMAFFQVFLSLLNIPPEQQRGYWSDYLVAVIVLTLNFLTLVGLVVFYFYRKYPGIRAKQPEIVLVSIISGILFSSSGLVANNHFVRPPDTIWADCEVWKIWLQYVFGLSVWINCLLLRSARLFRVFVQKKKTTLKFFFVGIALLQIPWIIAGILVDSLGGIYYVEEDQKCKFETGATITWIILFAIYVSALIFMILKTGPIVEHYSGYKELKLGLKASVIGLGLSVIFYIIKETINSTTESKLGSAVYRVCFTATLSGIVVFFFWKSNFHVMGKAIYNDQDYVQKLTNAITAYSFRDSSASEYVRSKKV